MLLGTIWQEVRSIPNGPTLRDTDPKEILTVAEIFARVVQEQVLSPRDHDTGTAS